jgi:hypothetical protein
MKIVPFEAKHLLDVDLQDSQAYLSKWITMEQAKAIEATEWAFTGVNEDGSLMGCAGLISMWQGRAMAWAYISKSAEGRNFIKVHKAVSRFFEACYIKRIEITVDCDFEQGHRWAEMLGFKMEAECMKSYRPDGGDCALYARVLP